MAQMGAVAVAVVALESSEVCAELSGGREGASSGGTVAVAASLPSPTHPAGMAP